MLQRLSIRNYALIEQLDLEIRPGMNIITGETGAGKSILLGALGLLLGQRADSGALFDKSGKCIVEGYFTSGKESPSIQQFLREHDLDEGPSVIVRREISPEGKSRAFINDTPVNLQQLKEFSSLLADIHSQHETLLLNRTDFQLSVLDAFAGITDDVKKYKASYREWLALRQQIDELTREEQRLQAERDYLEFQAKELEAAVLKPGEVEELEREQKTLSHAGEIQSQLENFRIALEEGEENVIGSLTSAGGPLQSLSKFDDRLTVLQERVKSCLIELKDIASEADAMARSFQADPARLEQVEQRLDVVYRLLQKHRVKNADELLVLGEEWQKKLDNIGSLHEQLAALQNKEVKTASGLLTSAEKLSSARKKAAPSLIKTLQSMLASVALQNAVFDIDLKSDSENVPGPNGIDLVRFLFSANKGTFPAEIGKVASGGELSRLMLCIKAAVASKMEFPTIIFDEIDTGISGETAFKVGEVLYGMASSRQMIVITHLPQIASRGDAHYFVKKQVSGKKTLTTVLQLTPEERQLEIARMLSGDKPTAAALANAKELLTR